MRTRIAIILAVRFCALAPAEYVIAADNHAGQRQFGDEPGALAARDNFVGIIPGKQDSQGQTPSRRRQ